jgi:nucleotide-binding universal stress UspA family protein
MKTIVIGYDDTEPSKRALDRALGLAKAFGASLVVTSVAPVGSGGGRSMGALDPTDTPADHREELAHARAAIESAGVPAQYVLGVGDAADAIVEAAEEHGADLIVVGARELGFTQRLLGQSVSGEVAREAHCDVLIVHSPRAE